MCKCSYKNCQFEWFLKKDKHPDYTNKLSGGHRYCIFHDKKENKDSHADYFDELIHKYIEYRVLNSKNSGVHINFNGVIFLEFNFHNLVNMYEDSKKDTSVKINHDNKKLNFKFDNAVFESYARFDNIKCNKITFKDTKFLSGGSIKSREKKDNKKDNLEIDTLVFRPLELGSDFMIDLGKYADENSILSHENGVIKNIQFNNHQIGDGRVFFVGLNDSLNNGDFRNRILDNVIFKNCDLRKCQFASSKVNETEFRNCTFPVIRNQLAAHPFYKRLYTDFILFPSLVILIYFVSINNVVLESLSIYNEFYIFLAPFLIYVLLASVHPFLQPIEYTISKIFHWIPIGSYAYEGARTFNYHFSTKDEEKIFSDKKASKKEKMESLNSLLHVYKQLKENFEKNDFQMAGNFFYSQRYLETISESFKTKSMADTLLLSTHYVVNGFGERFVRPVVFFMLTVILFSFFTDANKDYVATANTPYFLIKDANQTSNITYYKENSFKEYINIKGLTKEDKFRFKNFPIVNDNSKVKTFSLDENNSLVSLYYSFSHITLPFVSKEKEIFVKVTKDAVLLGYLESVLLWFFAGAFVLAVSHRIRR